MLRITLTVRSKITLTFIVKYDCLPHFGWTIGLAGLALLLVASEVLPLGLVAVLADLDEVSTFAVRLYKDINGVLITSGVQKAKWRAKGHLVACKRPSGVQKAI